MKRNTIRVKLYSDKHTATKPNTYVEIRKDQIKRVIIGLTCGMEDGADYASYYFTFMMKSQLLLIS